MKTITGNKTTNGWGKVRIGDALRLINGRAFKPSEWRERGIPIVRIQNLNNPEAPFNYFEGDLPEKFLLNNGDLLFAWSGTPGTSFGAHIWRGGKAWLNQHIFKVMFDEAEFNKKFLQLAINQNLNEYIRAAHGGAGLAHITKGRFEQSELVKPTLDEQRDIVAEIEKQFSRLDEAIANLKRVKANLKRYKAAVLKAAVEGKLTEDWRKQHPNVEPASKLLERILGERRTKWNVKGKYKEPCEPGADSLRPIPNSWTWASLELVCPRFVDSAHRTPRYGQTGVPALGPRDVVGGKLNVKNARLVDEAEYAIQTERHVPEAGDIVYSRELSLGWGAILPPGVRVCLSQGMCLFSPHEAVNSRYFIIVLNGPHGRYQAELAATGSAHPHVNLSDIKKYSIPLPPSPEQELIVAEAERRLSVIEELEATVEANLTRADRLRQSILGQAFSGKLLFNGARG